MRAHDMYIQCAIGIGQGLYRRQYVYIMIFNLFLVSSRIETIECQHKENALIECVDQTKDSRSNAQSHFKK